MLGEPGPCGPEPPNLRLILQLPLVSFKKVTFKTSQPVISSEARNLAVNWMLIKDKISRFARNDTSTCFVVKSGKP
jgi:hypothetical protein